MIIIENEVFGNVAMMIVGGIAVDTIEMEEGIEEGRKVEQGQELGRFHMGGSAAVLVIPKNEKFCTRSDIAVSSLCGVEYEVRIGDVLTGPRQS
eukprot:SAG31_NODE_572_length_13974_cov_28.935640_3_plen_94_part_00